MKPKPMPLKVADDVLRVCSDVRSPGTAAEPRPSTHEPVQRRSVGPHALAFFLVREVLIRRMGPLLSSF